MGRPGSPGVILTMLEEAVHYSRMALGIHEYLRSARHPDPQGLIRRQLENRETIFLDTACKAIFSNPRNPYHEMFRLAGCSFEDLERVVRKDGLDPTLAVLLRQGVYLTHDEFKGKTAIVRSGRHIPAHTSDFRNPFCRGRVIFQSSGSRSKGTRAPKSTEDFLYREAFYEILDLELDLVGRARIELKAILPSMTGLIACLQASRRGLRVERWFAAGGDLRSSGHYRWMTRGMVGWAKLLGAQLPFPAYLPPNDFAPVAEWIAQRRAAGRACVMGSVASPAVRVAAAALEKGLDISGTTFVVGGEALTDAKRTVIESAGVSVRPRYAMTEIGGIGHACRQMNAGNCVHLNRDRVAVITERQRPPFSDVEVNALLFTTLLPFAPHVLINAEMGDSGVVEPARCDCLFTRLGFTEQVRDIASFAKLTGQGMTLVGTDIVRLLEEILPARLGGSPGDYQLVEHEGAAQTQLSLRISPRAGVSDPAKAKECFLKEIRRFYGGTLAARTWSHAAGVDVTIAEPLSTLTGKVLVLHLSGSAEEKSHAS
jgi:hypothetical protein